MSFALVGLATGLGARYPRFNADNPSQVAGSYGGVAFMILAVVVIIATIVLLGWPSSVLLWYRATHLPIPRKRSAIMGLLLRGGHRDGRGDVAERHADGRPRARIDGRIIPAGERIKRMDLFQVDDEGAALHLADHRGLGRNQRITRSTS